MSKNLLITPEGTKDFLFEEVITRKSVERQFKDTFTQRGFYEVQTPTMEFLDVFSVKGHGIPIEDMFKLVDSKGRLMVVRPDSTMPIARLAATRLRQAELPLRLFYNQSVYSITRQMSGQSNETMQTGVELIGKSSKKADLEIIFTAMTALLACNQNTLRIEIGHIGIFNSVISRLETTIEQKEKIRSLIEAKNYPALNDLLDALGDCYEIGVIKQLPRLFGGVEVFKKAAKIINNDDTIEILSYLEDLYNSLNSLGLDGKITVDLGVVNRTDYYTGVVFKGYIEGCGDAVLSGGRYDGLLAQFGENLGAIGFAINVDAVSRAVLCDQHAVIKSPKVLVHSAPGFEIHGLNHMKMLADEQICEYSMCETVEEATDYARKKGIPQVDVVTDIITTIKGV